MSERDYILSHMSPTELADAQAMGIQLTRDQQDRLATYLARRRELAAVEAYPTVLHDELKRRAS